MRKKAEAIYPRFPFLRFLSFLAFFPVFAFLSFLIQAWTSQASVSPSASARVPEEAPCSPSLPRSAHHFFGSQVFLLAADRPNMSERIRDHAEPISPELVGQGHENFRPRGHRLGESGVTILHPEMDIHGGALERLR